MRAQMMVFFFLPFNLFFCVFSTSSSSSSANDRPSSRSASTCSDRPCRRWSSASARNQDPSPRLRIRCSRTASRFWKRGSSRCKSEVFKKGVSFLFFLFFFQPFHAWDDSTNNIFSVVRDSLFPLLASLALSLCERRGERETEVEYKKI